MLVRSIDHPLVNLIRNNKNIVLFAKICNQLEFSPGEDLANGVVRSIEDD
jgi:hypothetical protein